MSNFEFENGERVIIACSGEQGVIIGRAEYSTSENQYYLRYKAGDGRAVDSWWAESALTVAQ